MSWDRIEGQWKQRRGKAVRHWGKMMNDELAAIAGRYEELVGRLQEKYGIAKEEASEQLDVFKKTVEQLKSSNGRMMKMQKELGRRTKEDRARVKTEPRARKGGRPKRGD